MNIVALLSLTDTILFSFRRARLAIILPQALSLANRGAGRDSVHVGNRGDNLEIHPSPGNGSHPGRVLSDRVGTLTLPGETSYEHPLVLPQLPQR